MRSGFTHALGVVYLGNSFIYTLSKYLQITCFKYIFSQQDLKGWSEYIKDYDFTIVYNPGKENLAADGLS